MQLGVGELPQEEVAEAAFPSGADEEVRGPLTLRELRVAGAAAAEVLAARACSAAARRP